MSPGNLVCISACQTGCFRVRAKKGVSVGSKKVHKKQETNSFSCVEGEESGGGEKGAKFVLGREFNKNAKRFRYFLEATNICVRQNAEEKKRRE